MPSLSTRKASNSTVTKRMSDRVFLDTNILVYSYSVSEHEKQVIARKLITETDSYISTQVLTELANTLTRKFKLDYAVTLKALNECCARSEEHTSEIQQLMRNTNADFSSKHKN